MAATAKKKKFKIKGLEAALLKLPESQREEARAAVLASFEDFDPENNQGKPVEKLARGQMTCPRCGGPITVLQEEPVTLPGGDVVQLAECGPCDQPYCMEPLN
jgi:hypothetical protein